MKQLLSLLLLLLVLAVPLAGLAEYTTNPSGTIVGGTAYVFENNPPLPGEPAKGTIPNGATVVVSQTQGDFRYVFYFEGGGVLQGWVDRNAVRMVTPQPTFVPEPTYVPWPTPRPTQRPPVPAPTYRPAPTPMPPSDVVVVISESVTLRQNPSTTATKITSLKNGATLNILGQQNGWYYVSYWDGRNALSGWVSGDYVVINPAYITATGATYAYSMPDRGSKKVGQVVSGTTLLVIGDYGDFWVVNLRTASAFIYKWDVR